MIDFSRARLLDRLWWKRLHILLDQVEKRNYADLVKMQHTQHAGALDYTVGQKAFDHHWDGCNHVTSMLRKLRFPWLKEDDIPADRAVDQLREEWMANFGDPNDPETQKRIQSTVNFLMNRPAGDQGG